MYPTLYYHKKLAGSSFWPLIHYRCYTKALKKAIVFSHGGSAQQQQQQRLTCEASFRSTWAPVIEKSGKSRQKKLFCAALQSGLTQECGLLTSKKTETSHRWHWTAPSSEGTARLGEELAAAPHVYLFSRHDWIKVPAKLIIIPFIQGGSRMSMRIKLIMQSSRTTSREKKLSHDYGQYISNNFKVAIFFWRLNYCRPILGFYFCKTNERIIELELTGRCDRTEMSHRSGGEKSTGRCSDQQRSEGSGSSITKRTRVVFIHRLLTTSWMGLEGGEEDS